MSDNLLGAQELLSQCTRAKQAWLEAVLPEHGNPEQAQMNKGGVWEQKESQNG